MGGMTVGGGTPLTGICLSLSLSSLSIILVFDLKQIIFVLELPCTFSYHLSSGWDGDEMVGWAVGWDWAGLAGDGTAGHMACCPLASMAGPAHHI